MPVPRRFDRQPPERDTTRINERIRVPEVRLIDETGAQVGIMKTQEALRYAQSKDLDLVWLARDGRVLRVDRGVGPGRLKLCLRAGAVVATAAGGGDAFAAVLDRV